jgi:threonine dehydratase
VIPYDWVENASTRISNLITNTPVTYDPVIETYFKWENKQKTGSFKIRGAANKILSLNDWELSQGLVTCSAGNHGQGVALAAQICGASCTVFATPHTPAVKVKAMEKLGASVILVDGGYAEAEKTAINFSKESHKTFISPYNDGQVVAGQGTIALEIINHFRDVVPFKTLLVPVGGGGLISGIGSVFYEHSNRPKLIGVQSEASAFAYQLIHTDSQEGVEESASIAEGLAGEIDHESITIPLMKKLVDEMILVTELEILEAILFAWKTYGEVIEGSAAVGLAAVLTGKIQLLPVMVVITGGNIQPELFDSIIKNS